MTRELPPLEADDREADPGGGRAGRRQRRRRGGPARGQRARRRPARRRRAARLGAGARRRRAQPGEPAPRARHRRGREVEPVALPAFGARAGAQADGLSTARGLRASPTASGAGARELDPGALRRAGRRPLAAAGRRAGRTTSSAAALALRPELGGRWTRCARPARSARAVSGSGPTRFGALRRPARRGAAAAAIARRARPPALRRAVTPP